MLMKSVLATILAIASLLSCTKQYDVTLSDLLDEMTDRYSCCEYPEIPFKSMMTSSHDRRSVNPSDDTWYANDDGFGYEYLDQSNGRQEKVLLEQEGPGVITRIWITTRNPKSTLRFYFDGHAEPDWVVNSFDFTEFGLKALEDNPLVCKHTSYEKGIKGGQTFLLPLPYASGCKVTLEEPEGWSGVPRYYHFEYRKYPENVTVETFSVDVASRMSDKIRRTGDILAENKVPSGHKTEGHWNIDLPKGDRAVTMLSVSVSGLDTAKYEHTMRKLILKAIFDGKETIRVPLSDFSGAGMGAYPVDCRQLYSNGGGVVKSYWVMPYSKTASFEVENTSAIECDVFLEAYTEKYEFTENTLYFHSSWKASEDLSVTNVQSDCGYWDFATISGRGIYVGDNLTLFNHSKAWYGEGDEKIFIDGESFPSFFGTGTEDYYNSSWAPVVIFHTPVGGAPRADLASSRGYNTFLRTRLTDVIPFESRFDFDLELISWVPGTVDYASTIYWYGDAETIVENTVDPVTHVYQLPEAPPDPSKFIVSNSIEAESLDPVFISETLHMDRQDMAGFPDGVWSGAKQLVFYGGKKGDTAILRINDLEKGKYVVSIYATMAADYGIAQIRLNGGKPFYLDCWFPAVVNTGSKTIGEVAVEDSIEIEIKIHGQNPKSKSNMLGVDCIVLDKITE